jgi:hypothetical protein
MKYGLAACMALVLWAFPLQTSSAAEPVGKVSSAKTAVYGAGTAGRKSLERGDPIFFLDKLSTNGTGIGEFVFQDGTKVAIGPSASIVVDKFVLKNRSTFEKFGVNATKGTFRWISGRSPSSAYQIRTPTGTMAMRGTALDVSMRNGVLHAVLLNGNASVCRGGACQTLNRPGDYVTARGGSVSEKKNVKTAFRSRAEAARIFPFLANPNLLSRQFRVSGSNLLSNASFGRSGGNGAPAGSTGGTASGGTTGDGGTGDGGTGGGGAGGGGTGGGNPCGGNCGVGKGGGGGNGTGNEGKGKK